MSRNNRTLLAITLLASLTCASAQMMTITEKTLRQSEIARAEMELRLAQIKKTDDAARNVPVNPTLTSKTADEVLRLISVYGVNNKLKADFAFQGGVVTLEPQGSTSAAGWVVEKLTATEATLVKMSGKKVVRRNTVYLTPEAGQSMASEYSGSGGVPSMPLPSNGRPPPSPIAAVAGTPAPSVPGKQ